MTSNKEASKLQKYVHRDASQDLADLKMAPPRLSNGSNTRTKSQPNGKVSSAPEQPRRPSDGRPTFYDTDASEADKTSTSVSTRRANTSAGRAQQSQPQARGLEGSSSGEEGSEDEDGSDEELPSNPLASGRKQDGVRINGELSQKQRALVNKHKHEKAVHADGITSKYVDGDSYPTTTSGRPSVSDLADLGETAKAQLAQQNQSAPIVPPTQAGRQSAMRAPLAQQSVQNHASSHRPVPVYKEDFVLERSGAFQAPAGAGHTLEHDVTAGFIFGKKTPTLQQPSIRPSGQPRPKAPPQNPAPHQSLSTNIPERGSRTVTQSELLADHDTIQDTAKSAHAKAPAPQERSEKRAKSKHVSRTSTPVQSAARETAPEPEALSDHAFEDENAPPNGFHPEYEQQQEPKAELDYDESELYALDYRTLKEAKFDTDPNAAVFAMPDDLPVNTLAEQLASVSRLQGLHQEHFMATLDIEQWEEAGDWFLDSFGQLMSRFRTARQEKRKAARRFEDEVENRHDAVSRKRKWTEHALGEMKASGAQVLQGTPKKLKKTK